STASKGSYDNTTGDWTIGGLANGTNETLTVTATINANGIIVNTASVTANEFDRNAGDNTSTSTINVGTSADISISKISNAGPFFNGDNIVYTIVVANAGPSDATGVVATDVLPA